MRFMTSSTHLIGKPTTMRFRAPSNSELISCDHVISYIIETEVSQSLKRIVRFVSHPIVVGMRKGEDIVGIRRIEFVFEDRGSRSKPTSS